VSVRGAGAGAALSRGLGRARTTYVRRQPEGTVLHQVVRAHLETFLAEARRRGSGEGVPRFVERELREFLTCGVMARGFARFRCDDCGHEMLVAYSCKGRICPSCGGRRMAALAAHLVDGVLGGLPVRQWVLTLPYRLRYALAWDHRLCRAVLAVFMRAVLTFERRRAARRGVRGGVGGAVTAIQRCGSALNINVHFHSLVVQGVFVQHADGTRRFVPAPAPTDLEVTRLLGAIRRRIVRLVARHGIDLECPSTEVDPSDERLVACPVYAEIQGAAVLGRVATGPRAGAAVVRVGRDPAAPVDSASGPLHAQLDGFDLHAAVAVPAGHRSRLEHLARYVLRPPVAQEALEWTPDGKVLLRLRRPWRDGTRAIRFEPTELLEKLAAAIPKPRINLLIYYGAFAPHARDRQGAVRTSAGPSAEGFGPQAGSLWSGGRAQTSACHAAAAPTVPGAVGDPATGLATRTTGGDAPPVPGAPAPPDAIGADLAPPTATAPPAPPPSGGYTRPKHYAWAALLQRILVHPINCRPRRGSVRACPDHAPVSSPVRAGARARRAAAQLG